METCWGCNTILSSAGISNQIDSRRYKGLKEFADDQWIICPVCYLRLDNGDWQAQVIKRHIKDKTMEFDNLPEYSRITTIKAIRLTMANCQEINRLDNDGCLSLCPKAYVGDWFIIDDCGNELMSDSDFRRRFKKTLTGLLSEHEQY